MVQQRLVVGITGASGVIYGIRLLEVLHDCDFVETHLILTDAARQTMALETTYRPADVTALADVVYAPNDIAATIASGSFLTDGMIVAPCSMKSLGAITFSMAENLLVRAADVTLKERRRLVLVARETPLHLGHLRLMTQVTEQGAIILPPIPAFYHRPTTIDDLVNHTVNRALDLVGIRLPHDLFRRWQGPRSAPPPDQETAPE
jgi:4-hydroxy-3-polyprenylbenzoate decarboxylase